jgi:integrating conjugative element membrane protein (TIGR03747 family)
MAAKNNEPTVSQTVLWPVWKLLRIFFAVLLIYLASVIAFLGRAYYVETRTDRILWADDMIGFYVAQSPTPAVTERYGYWVYSGVFEWPQYVFKRMTKSRIDAADSQPYSGGATGGLTAKVKMSRQEIYQLAQRASYLFGVKLSLVMVAMPLIVLFFVVGVTDGLVERYIRRKCVGHESSTWYHRFKRMSYAGLFPLTAVTWLCIPVKIHAAWFLIPMALIFATAIRFQIKYYKKYQ